MAPDLMFLIVNLQHYNSPSLLSVIFMSRSRFSSQEVFLSEVDRLQKERSRLLKERNHQEFPKPMDYNPYVQSGTPQRGTDQDPQQFTHSRRSPRANNNNPTSAPNIEQVKVMLEDIMKNSEKHGMNKSLSLQYLKDIQGKLTREIEEFNTHMRRTVESDKLRSLKVFVDRLVLSYDSAPVITKGVPQKAKQVKEGINKPLDKIPEAIHPSISSMDQSISSSSPQLSSSEYKSSSQIESSQESDSNVNKDITMKKISSSNASGLLDLLENRIFDEVSALRQENTRLKKEIEQLRDDRSYSRGKRRDSINENETLINQLVRADPKSFESENKRLKNKIRSLEMELLSIKSLNDLGQGDSRMYMSGEGKDKEIRYLRKQMQQILTHLQSSKQEVEYLKEQVFSLTSKLSSRADHQQKLLANIQALQSQLHRVRGATSRVQPQYQRYQRNAQNQYPSESKRKAPPVPDFKKKTFANIQNSEREFNHDVGKSSDRFGEYREVLFTLRSLRK